MNTDLQPRVTVNVHRVFRVEFPAPQIVSWEGLSRTGALARITTMVWETRDGSRHPELLRVYADLVNDGAPVAHQIDADTGPWLDTYRDLAVLITGKGDTE